jgi:dolichol-phosphate mannosyltransferase
MADPELSVVIPVWSREHDLERLLPELLDALEHLGVRAEVIVAAEARREDVRAAASRAGAWFAASEGAGYGSVLRAGLTRARGAFLLTMDPDHSHHPDYVGAMWRERQRGDLLIGSRYVQGAHVEMGPVRRALSRTLNRVYRWIMALPIRDLSSGFRLVRRRVLDDIGPLEADGLDVLPEIAAKAFSQGWRIVEVPLWYRGVRAWSRLTALRLGWGYARTLGRIVALRNSVRAADYDHRAFDSWIPLQRHWQRRRYEVVRDYLRGTDGPVLDVGCGSGRTVQTIRGVVGLDVALRKLRWLRASGRHLVQGDMSHPPFRDRAFDAVVCSEVIEHVPRERVRLDRLVRLIRPGGLLIVATPDYGRARWRVLEWLYGKILPGGYANEHVNPYTYTELREHLTNHMGLEVLEVRYVGGSDMVFKARVPASALIKARSA